MRAKKLPATGDLYELGTLLAYDALGDEISGEEFEELAAGIQSPERLQRKKTFSQFTHDDGEGLQLTRRSKRQKKEVCYADDFSYEFEDEEKL